MRNLLIAMLCASGCTLSSGNAQLYDQKGNIHASMQGDAEETRKFIHTAKKDQTIQELTQKGGSVTDCEESAGCVMYMGNVYTTKDFPQCNAYDDPRDCLMKIVLDNLTAQEGSGKRKPGVLERLETVEKATAENQGDIDMLNEWNKKKGKK